MENYPINSFNKVIKFVNSFWFNNTFSFNQLFIIRVALFMGAKTREITKLSITYSTLVVSHNKTTIWK